MLADPFARLVADLASPPSPPLTVWPDDACIRHLFDDDDLPPLSKPKASAPVSLSPLMASPGEPTLVGLARYAKGARPSRMAQVEPPGRRYRR